MLELLSTDLLIEVLAFLGTPKTISNVFRVSKKLSLVGGEEKLWHRLAIQRYGQRVAEGTSHLYGGSYKLMMKDDNQQGALPTLDGLWKSDWRHNTVSTFYICLITSVKWHKASNQIYIYLDVRGQSDLRRPQTSGLSRRDPETGRVNTLENLPNADGSYNMEDLTGFGRNVCEYEFVSLLAANTNQGSGQGRFKGILKVNADLFTHPGQYEFCYANANPTVYRDYDSCTLFEVTTEGGLKDVFPSYSMEGETPFDGETKEVEMERWRAHLPTPRPTRNLLGPWPECIGMRGEDAVKYIKSQNPDLDVKIVHGPIPMYYCDSEVRMRVDSSGIVRGAPKRG